MAMCSITSIVTRHVMCVLRFRDHFFVVIYLPPKRRATSPTHCIVRTSVTRERRERESAI